MNYLKINKVIDKEIIEKYNLVEIEEENRTDFKLYIRNLKNNKLEELYQDFPETKNIENILSLKAIKFSLYKNQNL